MIARLGGAVLALATVAWVATPASAAVDETDETSATTLLPFSTRVPAQVTDLTTTVQEVTAQFDEASPLTATVTVTNPTAGAMDNVSVVLELTEESLDTSAEVDEFVASAEDFTSEEVARAPEVEASGDTAQSEDADAGDSADGDATEDTSESDEEAAGVTVAAGGTETFTIEAPDLAFTDPGVYGLTVSVTAGSDTAVVDTVPVSWTEGVEATLDLAMVVEASGSAPAVNQTLMVAADPRVAIAADPSLLTNASVLDGGLLERETVWLPAGDIDITSLAHAEDPRLLDFTVNRDPAASLARSIDAPWIAPVAVVDEATAALAADSGAVAVLPSADAVGIGDARDQLAGATVGMVDGADVPVLMPHEALTRTLATYRPGSPEQWNMMVAQTLLAAQSESPAALIAPGETWQSTGATSALITDMFDLPWVNPTTVASLVADGGEDVTLDPVLDAEADLDAHRVLTLGDQLSPLGDMASMTTNPDEAFDTWASSLVQGVTTVGRQGPAGRDIAYATALQDAHAVVDGVRISSASDLNLLAADGEVPVTIENDLDWDVEAVVELVSDSPNLVVEGRPTVTVPAHESATGLVEVSAVSSANVELSAQLLTTAGADIGESHTYSVRVRADWGTAATLIFTGLLVLLLIAGVIRTIRRGRKDTRTDAVVIPGSEVPATSLGEASDEGNDERGRDG